MASTESNTSIARWISPQSRYTEPTASFTSARERIETRALRHLLDGLVAAAKPREHRSVPLSRGAVLRAQFDRARERSLGFAPAALGHIQLGERRVRLAQVRVQAKCLPGGQQPGCRRVARPRDDRRRGRSLVHGIDIGQAGPGLRVIALQLNRGGQVADRRSPNSPDLVWPRRIDRADRHRALRVRPPTRPRVRDGAGERRPMPPATACDDLVRDRTSSGARSNRPLQRMRSLRPSISCTLITTAAPARATLPNTSASAPSRRASSGRGALRSVTSKADPAGDHPHIPAGGEPFVTATLSASTRYWRSSSPSKLSNCSTATESICGDSDCDRTNVNAAAKAATRATMTMAGRTRLMSCRCHRRRRWWQPLSGRVPLPRLAIGNHRSDEAITLSAHGFDVTRRRRGVAERFANPPDAHVQRVVEVDERAVWPELLPQLIAR